ncbi:hypothetical protein ACJX0J_038776 [Zea mays]
MRYPGFMYNNLISVIIEDNIYIICKGLARESPIYGFKIHSLFFSFQLKNSHDQHALHFNINVRKSDGDGVGGFWEALVTHTSGSRSLNHQISLLLFSIGCPSMDEAVDHFTLASINLGFALDHFFVKPRIQVINHTFLGDMLRMSLNHQISLLLFSIGCPSMDEAVDHFTLASINLGFALDHFFVKPRIQVINHTFLGDMLRIVILVSNQSLALSWTRASCAVVTSYRKDTHMWIWHLFRKMIMQIKIFICLFGIFYGQDFHGFDEKHFTRESLETFLIFIISIFSIFHIDILNILDNLSTSQYPWCLFNSSTLAICYRSFMHNIINISIHHLLPSLPIHLPIEYRLVAWGGGGGGGLN